MFLANSPDTDEGNNDAGMEIDEANLPKFSEFDPDNLTPEQAKELIKSNQTLLGQAKHWRNKAKPKPAPVAPQPNNNNNSPSGNEVVEKVGKIETDVASLKMVEEKRQFGHANGLSPEETDEVFAYAIGHGIRPTEALEKPFVKSALASLREDAQNRGAIPGPSNRRPLVGGKPFNELSRDDKIKNFGNLVKSTQRRR